MSFWPNRHVQALTPSSGHYAVLFAVALGAEVTAFSHSANKKDDAIKMGVKHFVITDKGFEKDHVRELDLIISSSSSNKLPLGELLSCLDVHGKLVFVGMPEEPLTIGPQMLGTFRSSLRFQPNSLP